MLVSYILSITKAAFSLNNDFFINLILNLFYILLEVK